MEKIETFGTKCFVKRGITGDPAVYEKSFNNVTGSALNKQNKTKKVREKINFKYGKVKIQISGTGHIKIKEENGALNLFCAQNIPNDTI
jgi:hypothetical protein